MSEVEKMYENAGVEPTILDYPDNIEPFYPDFTPEEQLSLIKWLCQNKGYTMLIKYINSMNSWRIECNFNGVISEGSFEECFAYLINDLWQDLTIEQREQIRSILNG